MVFGNKIDIACCCKYSASYESSLFIWEREREKGDLSKKTKIGRCEQKINHGACCVYIFMIWHIYSVKFLYFKVVYAKKDAFLIYSKEKEKVFFFAHIYHPLSN